jgi:hypothetical protein
MPRNVEDIIPKKGRSIRDVPVPEERRHRGRRASDRMNESEGISIPIHKEHIPEESFTPTVAEEATDHMKAFKRETVAPRMRASFQRDARPHSTASRKGLWLSLGLGALVVTFAIFSLLKSATLTYTPKTAPLTFQNEAFTAYKAGGEGVLLFSVVKISDTKGVQVPATGETHVSKKASGTIIVYNNASSASQALVKTTRFQTPEGKIYRIPNDISVPGKTSAGPGSLEVTVVADQPGADYNIGLSDFTLPGLKGDPKFTTVYARSKTPMTGGIVGSEKGVDPSAEAAAKTKNEADLRAQLAEEAQAQVPADFILYPSLSTTAFSDLPQSSSTDNTVTVNEKGDYLGVIFKKGDLADYIKNKKLSIPANQSITISNLSGLDLQFTGTMSDDLLKATVINFQANGDATAVWTTDETSLKKDLSGVSKSDLASVLKNYPSILSADAVIRPFWKTSFPSLPADITVKRAVLK